MNHIGLVKKQAGGVFLFIIFTEAWPQNANMRPSWLMWNLTWSKVKWMWCKIKIFARLQRLSAGFLLPLPREISAERNTQPRRERTQTHTGLSVMDGGAVVLPTHDLHDALHPPLLHIFFSPLSFSLLRFFSRQDKSNLWTLYTGFIVTSTCSAREREHKGLLHFEIARCLLRIFQSVSRINVSFSELIDQLSDQSGSNSTYLTLGLL